MGASKSVRAHRSQTGIDRNGVLKINRHFSLSSMYFLTEDFFFPSDLKFNNIHRRELIV